MRGILIGPPKVPMTRTSLYRSLVACVPANENGLASHAEVSACTPRAKLYNAPGRRRLFPNAAGCANGDAAPLFTLPLITKPSDASIPAASLDSSLAAALARASV